MVKKRDWKLIRCIYDYMGMGPNEIETPELFDKKVKKGEQISWCIATIIDFKGQKLTRIELEGSKENLEFVLSCL